MLKFLLVNEWRLIPLSRQANENLSFYILFPLMIVGIFISIYSIPHYLKRRKYLEAALATPMVLYFLFVFFLLIR